jgi:hypothetical protein
LRAVLLANCLLGALDVVKHLCGWPRLRIALGGKEEVLRGRLWDPGSGCRARELRFTTGEFPPVRFFVWAARAGLERFRKNVRGVLLGIFPNLTLRSSL